MLSYLLIAIGGAIGSMARFGFSGLVARATGATFPYGTMFVNVTGAAIIGFFATLTGPDGRVLASAYTRQFVMVGICGGYTTFSSFSLETLNLINDGQWLAAGTNVLMSVMLCMIAVWAGYVAASALSQGA
ncbi:MAG TPA: fluoride efflux transporter CrcB [Candidatus Binataceae bacterium]|nr:fluoride efflux transporter CrcB [Candidatus Binataceae bacterium]